MSNESVMAESESATPKNALVPDRYFQNYAEFDKDWISTSALSLLMVCGHAFKLKYIDKIREPIGVRMTAGTGAHKGREVNLSQKIESQEDLSVDQVTDAARDTVNERFQNNEIQVDTEFEGKSKEQAQGIAVDFAVAIAEKDREVFQPEIQPVTVEKSMAVEYPGLNRIIVGTVDTEEARDVIRDLKSGKRAFGQSKADDGMGLSTYGMLKYACTGKLASEYLVDNVVCTGKTPCKTNAYRTTRTELQLQKQLRRFVSWAKIIDAGLFAPSNPEHWKCSPDWCGYWSQCPYGGGK